jgi:hypothetical protein
MSGDPIDRAVARNSVVPGSSLEKEMRANAYKLIDTAGGSGTDGKLDEFIKEARANPFYAPCFTAPPGPAKAAETVKQPTVQELAALGASGKVSGAAKAAASETRAPQMGEIAQPSAEEFEQLQR